MTPSTRRLTVTLKIAMTVAAVIFAIVTFLVTYYSVAQKRLLTDSLRRKAESLSRLAAHDLGPSLEFGDPDAMKEVLGGITLDGDVVYASLLANDGKVLSEAKSIPEGVKLVPTSWEKLRSEAPVIDDNGAYQQVDARVTSKSGKGVLVMLVTTEQIRSEIRAALGVSLVLGLLTLLAGVGMAYLLGRSFGRRIGALAVAAGRVARGDLKQELLRVDGQDEIGMVGDAFNGMLVNLKQLEDQVLRVADGDLGQTTTLEGDLAQAFNRMIVSQRQLVKQIRDTALQVTTGAAEFLASARSAEHGATEQSSAVEETRRTMDTLLTSSREIAKTAQSVLANAERSQENSQVVATRIAALSKHAQRIAEILEVIKDIANKSDLLALNAALEGTKAGEVGRGFSLVATQMQRLAENVMGSVTDIKELTATITEATHASVMATEESTKLATDTTRSAQQIVQIIGQQQTGTEQVSRAMDDVAHVATQAVNGSRQVVHSTEELSRLSDELQRLVSRFNLENLAAGERSGARVERTAQAAAGQVSAFR
jgi:methyl-accepting chemotaxis protein